MARLLRTLSIVTLCLMSQAGYCLALTGEIKLQQIVAKTSSNSLLSESSVNDYAHTQSSLRLKTYHQTGRWEFDFHYVVNAEYSDDLFLLNNTNQFPSSNNHWFDLDSDLSRSNSHLIDHQVDRASVHYLSDQWVIKLGRQAITWGNGILFHPMDLFNPFSPDAKDTRYKPGIDMAYAQLLFDSGADLQLLWRPGKDEQGHYDSTRSSVAARYLFFVDRLQLHLMVADDYEQEVLGFGVVSPIGEAVIKLDMVSTESNDNHSNVSWDINLQHSWQIADKPMSGFVEYFHNGFSKRNITALDQLTREQIMRFQRGQSFTSGEDYLAIGIQLQWSPLVMVSPSVIRQLNDNSHLFLANVDYNLSDSSRLILGVRLALGERGTEYGGLYLNSNSPVTVTTADQLYLRYDWYF